MTPTEIRLNHDRSHVSITWDDGTTTGYSAALLRERSRDANSVRIAVDGWTVPAARSIVITGIEPIGRYGLRFAFSDGHDRGIFPWSYLIAIAECASRRSADAA
jgi:DUF971 family protein